MTLAKRGTCLAGLAFVALLSGCSSVGTEPIGPAHHVEGGFRNTEITDPNKTFFHFLAMRAFGDTKWADHAARAGEVPVTRLSPEKLDIGPDAPPQISWLGHSTFLIQVNGINILTDPIFSDRASPFSFSGPERYVPHVIDYAKLPKIDYVVISHNHYDHLDDKAVEVLGDRPVYLVPLGLADWFADEGVPRERVREFDWWDQAGFDHVTFQAMPSQHWSARGLFDRRTTLWASWLMTFDEKKIWFAGDTGYNDKQFKEIGEKADGIDLALIPIGAYAPRSFMKLYHVNPEEAVKLHRDIGAKKSIGMHWGTFPLTAEGPGDPVDELSRQRGLAGLTPDEFTTMVVGELRILDSQTSGKEQSAHLSPQLRVTAQ
ncbi:MBL fold metallo-hydrolase [Aestuariispira insulae]|uniref:L-ascorbate metabolism protein UlaG (Beta-lactamase superfamily) n=1 Tax=Aestuariispira insulae TaxID=1461337 RepID=A0A3D9HRH7_9PROT|nr:MBL fold metallo-hydrolase [Aestuariispira insulae]RED52092.1 L-ascorbate metabolism protein UlaG (beta-lactamase superfamily) [Aestuariispira insulae]